MERKKLAVIFGGNSAEYEISLQSVFSVLKYINTDKYDVITIGMTRNGEFRYAEEQSKIANNTWHEDSKNLHPVVVSTMQELLTEGYLKRQKQECHRADSQVHYLAISC